MSLPVQLELITIELIEIRRQLNRIEATLKSQGAAIMSDVDNLLAQVQTTTTLEQSAVAGFNGLNQLVQNLSAQVAQLQAAGATVDPRIAQATAALAASANSLAAAIPANTPAAVAPVSPTPPATATTPVSTPPDASTPPAPATP